MRSFLVCLFCANEFVKAFAHNGVTCPHIFVYLLSSGTFFVCPFLYACDKIIIKELFGYGCARELFYRSEEHYAVNLLAQ